MIQRVILPKLGETVERATIENWLKKEGDKVERGDSLCEITTDKATLVVESYYKGTLLKILAQPGTELPINTLIAVVGDPGERIPPELLAEAGAAPAAAPTAKAATPPAAATPSPTPAAPPAPAPIAATAQLAAAAVPPVAAPAAMAADVYEAVPAPSGRIFASPRARKLAAADYVPLNVIRGSGPEGRIVEADITAYTVKLDAAKVTPLARKLAHEKGVDVLALAQGGRKVTKEDVLAARPASPPAAAATASATAAPPRPMPKAGRVKLTPMRRIIAERMSLSKREIPAYYLHIDVDMTDLLASRKKIMAQGGAKVSVNDYIVVACARALQEMPDCNTRWDGDGIIYRGEVNVGFAVALDQGLIVPVIKNIERKNLAQVADEGRALVEKARTKKLLPAEYEGGCLTVSNLGMFGIKHFIPIINPGESMIVGLGIAEERPIIRQGGIHIRRMMTVTYALDHRLIDGAVGARFAERVRDLLEAPAELEK